MFITRMAIPRRTVLRGLGASLALPLLDSMVPSLTAIAKAAAQSVHRLGFFYVSNGITMDHWHPKGEGKNFEISPVLSPLKAFKDQMVVVTGLANKEAEDQGSGPHTRVHAVWLNGTKPKRSEGADIQSATTIDQYAAAKLGQDT